MSAVTSIVALAEEEAWREGGSHAICCVISETYQLLDFSSDQRTSVP
jgi:hypothetical protein